LKATVRQTETGQLVSKIPGTPNSAAFSKRQKRIHKKKPNSKLASTALKETNLTLRQAARQ
jgi:hypothetical protein